MMMKRARWFLPLSFLWLASAAHAQEAPDLVAQEAPDLVAFFAQDASEYTLMSRTCNKFDQLKSTFSCSGTVTYQYSDSVT